MSPGARTALEAAGVKFGEVVENDPLFTYVELPEGWHKSGMSDSRGSELRDARGNVRATIFYKAAYYDRHASLSICIRYRIHQDYDYEDEHQAIRAVVRRGDKVVHATAVRYYGDRYDSTYFRASDQAFAEAESWLDEHYPNWRDPSAYWDD